VMWATAVAVLTVGGAGGWAALEIWGPGGHLDQMSTRVVIAVTVMAVVVITTIAIAMRAHQRSAVARARAEAESQRQAKLLNAIAEGTSDAVFVKDLQGRYLYANRAAAEFVDKSIQDLLGKDDSALFSPADAESLRKHDRQLMTENRSETSEETLTSAGATRTYLVTKGPLHDEAGRVTGLIGVSCDITERKHMEEALRASEERYRRFLDVLPDSVFVVENDIVTYCNPAFVRLRGARDADDILGMDVLEMYGPEAHASVRHRIDELLATGHSLPPIERRLTRIDGRTVPVLVAATQVVDRQRRAVLVVLRDLSRQHQAEAWAQSILSHTQDSVISTDQFGTITSFNAAAELSFGYSASEVLGCHISMLVPESTPEDAGHRREMMARRKDGTMVPNDVAVSGFDLDGERHIIAVARDVSERRKLEAELRQAHKMEALGQVAGGVAHDFNNLLTVILGYSDMLQEQFPEGDPRRQFASDIRRASGRAADLTRQLLTFSRRTVVAPKVIDVNAVVKDMNRMLRRVLGEDIELVLEIEPNVRPIFIDPGSLEQIVMNLCVNARDAMPRGGRLTIRTSHGPCNGGLDAAGSAITEGDYVRVSISDDGEGIPPDVRAHIFEPFFTTKGAGKGTGLGLAVVLGLVEQNGGHIHLDTVPQKGTTFTVALPVVDEAISIVSDVRPRAPRGGGETILVVEDEEPVRRLAVIALASAGYRVLEASDGISARQAFDQHQGHVDLVITDVVMPNLGGRELAESLLAKQASLCVIYTSGYADDAVLRHGISRADVPFLAKPYTPSGLLQKVRDVIDQAPASPIPPLV
jgi:PAS domain S-box-containing protein